MKRIDINFVPPMPGIMDILVNDHDPKENPGYLFITFDKPLTELKVSCVPGTDISNAHPSFPFHSSKFGVIMACNKPRESLLTSNSSRLMTNGCRLLIGTTILLGRSWLRMW